MKEISINIFKNNIKTLKKSKWKTTKVYPWIECKPKCWHVISFVYVNYFVFNLKAAIADISLTIWYDIMQMTLFMNR